MAMPKSLSKTSCLSPSSMFSGLMSRWISLLAYAVSHLRLPCMCSEMITCLQIDLVFG